MSNTSFKILKNNPEGEYKEKGSKFLAYAGYCENEKAVKSFLEIVRSKHPKSRHCCYAYIIGNSQDIQFVNDDGEPSGTAGKPILNQILSAGITYTCVAVIRYFGGTKLGASGLIRAYKTAAENALSKAEIINKDLLQVFSLRFEYEASGAVNAIINRLKLVIIKQTFEIDCLLEIGVKQDQIQQLNQELQLIKGIKVNSQGLKAV